MPGYVIHVIIAEEYAQNNNIENKEELIKGTMYPDSIKIKGETHYSPYCSSDTNLYEFLLDKKIDNLFNLGYFLHLVADCVFYNRYFADKKGINNAELVHSDYDILNKRLLKRYDITLPEEVKEYALFKEGELKVLTEEKVYEFINEISNYNLYELAEKILKEKDFKKF